MTQPSLYFTLSCFTLVPYDSSCFFGRDKLHQRAMKTLPLFVYHGSILSHQEVWLRLCIDESSFGNQVAWTRPFIFIKCLYFFRLRRDGEKQGHLWGSHWNHHCYLSRMTSQFIGLCSLLILLNGMAGHTDIKAARVCCYASLRLLKP